MNVDLSRINKQFLTSVAKRTLSGATKRQTLENVLRQIVDPLLSAEGINPDLTIQARELFNRINARLETFDEQGRGGVMDVLRQNLIKVLSRGKRDIDLDRIIAGEITGIDLVTVYLKFLYDCLRTVSNGLSPMDNLDIEEFAHCGSPGITVKPHFNWYYHFPVATGQEREDKKVIVRISLNVFASPRLINELDGFIVCHANCYYKVPVFIDQWLGRNDPVTIYFYENPSQKMIAELVRLTGPYIRNRENIPIGKELASGVYLVEDRTASEHLSELIADAGSLDPLLGQAVEKYFTSFSLSRRELVKRASAGQVEAVEILLEHLRSLMSGQGPGIEFI